MTRRYFSSLSSALRRGVAMLFSVDVLILVALASFAHVLTFGLRALAAARRRRISSLGTTIGAPYGDRIGQDLTAKTVPVRFHPFRPKIIRNGQIGM